MMVGVVEIVGWLVNAWRDRPVRRVAGLGRRLGHGRRRRARRAGRPRVHVRGAARRRAAGRSTTPASRSTRGGRCARRRRAPTPRATGGRGTTSPATRAGRRTPSTTTSCRRWPTIGETNGCGRVTWENNEDNGQYGTTMALMLLPHWTDGCMASMEGLFFEASGTTPYHFLTTAAMSKQSSNPVRELRYDNNDASIGVPYLQALGVRYVMVRTPEAKARGRGPAGARAAGHQRTVGDLPGRRLRHRRAARRPSRSSSARRPGDQRERNLELGTSWFQHRDEWAAIPADDGPEEWQRIDVAVDESRAVPDPDRPADDPDTRGKQVDIVVPDQDIEPVAAARRSRSATSRSASRSCPSTSTRSASPSWSRSATSRTGPSTAPRGRTASPPT